MSSREWFESYFTKHHITAHSEIYKLSFIWRKVLAQQKNQIFTSDIYIMCVCVLGGVALGFELKVSHLLGWHSTI
jgi:hypothetical protein